MEFFHYFIYFFLIDIDSSALWGYNNAMDKKNICKFNVANDDAQTISILNFCYEKNSAPHPRFTTGAIFRLHVVSRGKGTFVTLNNSIELKAGDVFITYPSSDYYIANNGGLEYMYISFLGLRAYQLTERAELTRSCSVRCGQENLIPTWEAALEASADGNLDLIAEGLLLYTVGKLCNIRNKAQPTNKYEKIVLIIKKQTEERFCDPKLNLNLLCAENFYNAKYVSAAFRKYMSVGFSEYITTLRLNNAQRLINSGFKSVKQIAALSGFDDALYFSKVYKQHYGSTPKYAIETWK